MSSELFNSGSSGTAFKLSLENDAAFIYGFYRQCERYFTRFIKLRKYNKTAYKFALRIQDSTVFNRFEVADAFLKAAQNGEPFKIDYGVALGKSPSRQLGGWVWNCMRNIFHWQPLIRQLVKMFRQGVAPQMKAKVWIYLKKVKSKRIPMLI